MSNQQSNVTTESLWSSAIRMITSTIETCIKYMRPAEVDAFCIAVNASLLEARTRKADYHPKVFNIRLTEEQLIELENNPRVCIQCSLNVTSLHKRR